MYCVKSNGYYVKVNKPENVLRIVYQLSRNTLSHEQLEKVKYWLNTSEINDVFWNKYFTITKRSDLDDVTQF